MRILYVTTIAGTMNFFSQHIKMLIDEGNTVEVACNCEASELPEYCLEYGLTVHNIPFSRSPLSKSNIKAYKEFKKLVENGNFDIVHTHTPNASACVRLACRRLRKKGLRVFYTAHGFHFYKGAPLKNWLIFYPIEWLCAHWTDTLITINHEDYALAQKHMHAKKVKYVPGVGIDLSKFEALIIDREEKRKELNIPNDAILLISVGELNDNKNHETVIKALNEMDVYYIIAGIGDKREHLQEMIDAQKMTGRIKLLGYRTDVRELYAASDLFVFPSFREGLSVALMEAMASGLPCAVSKIRGNVDLIDENGGTLFEPDDVEGVRKAIKAMLSDDRKTIGGYNANKIKHFGNDVAIKEIEKVYSAVQAGGDCELGKLLLSYSIRKEFNIMPSDKVLIYIAELNENKNQISLLDMIADIRKSRDNVTLLLVGEGSKKSEIIEKSKRLGIEDKVILTGQRKDVPALLAASDIAVPSSIREGLGLNVLESMASGVPVVAYDNRGHRSIIEDGVNGYIVENGDYKAMAERVMWLIDNSAEYARIAEAGIERVKVFSTENVVNMMKRIYE